MPTSSVGVFNVRDFGALGNGLANDAPAVQSALDCAKKFDGTLYLPPGRYLCREAIVCGNLRSRISIIGDGANVSQLFFTDGSEGIVLGFEQDGAMQPFGLTMLNVGLVARGRCGNALSIDYGAPEITSDHYQPSTQIRGVSVISDNLGSWSNGIVIADAWNVSMTDVFVSGDSANGVWNNMSGHGIRFERMCVNAHLLNVRCNFWAVGLFYQNASGPNTEGIFCTNCSMVAVKRGVWIIGNADHIAPRVSTLVWNGGMIENRVGGVLDGSAAFHLHNVWTALINGCQMLTETLDVPGTTYGLFLDNCASIVVTGCDLSGWKIGLITVGQCRAICSHGNTFANTPHQTFFTQDTIRSRSYGHVLFNDDASETDESGRNRIGFVN